MDYNAAWIFVRVAQAASFSAAARQLNMPKSTVSKRVAELEETLHVTLLQRTTRKLQLTEAGRLFFQSCQRAFQEIQEAESGTAGAQGEPQGTLRVSAPSEMTSDFVTLISEFMRQYTKVEVQLILTDRMVDLVGEGIDIALRAGSLEDSSLVAKKVGSSVFQLFASPKYLKDRGSPKTPQDLSSHSCLLFTTGETESWELRSGTKRARVAVKGAFGSNSLGALKTMALLGRGIALLPLLSCHDEIRSGQLVAVLPEWSQPEEPIHLVYPKQRFLATRTRAFVEFMAARFKILSS